MRDRALLHVHDALVVIAGGVAPLGGLPARPALAPWCRVVEDGRRVLLEHGGTVVTLEGRAATALVPRLLPLLDGSRTADEVLDTLGTAARPAVQNALSILAEQGLLTEGPLARSDGGVEVEAATYVVSITGRSTQALARERLASAHVAIVGSAPAAGELRRLLRRSGVGHVERCPAGRVPASDALVVGAPSRAEIATLDELNDLALARREAWLQVLPYDGRFVVAGPLYLPHVSACRDVLAHASRRVLGLRGRLRPRRRSALARTRAGAARRPRGGARGDARAAMARDRRSCAPRPLLRARGPLGRHAALRPCAARAAVPLVRAVAPAGAVVRGAPPGSSRRGDDALAEALERLEAAVSPLAGIVTHTVSATHMTDESRLPNCASELASSVHTLGAPAVDWGSGAHPDPDRARAAALGEALERYSALYLPPDGIRLATARELGSSAVDPARFALFHPAQLAMPGFPCAPFTWTTRTAWVEGTRLADGTRAFLPAELVYLARPEPSLRPIAYSTSNGLACAPTRARGHAGGALELIERDAVMIAWKCRLSLPLLDWSGDGELRRLESRYFDPAACGSRVLDGSNFFACRSLSQSSTAPRARAPPWRWAPAPARRSATRG